VFKIKYIAILCGFFPMVL